MSGFSNFLTNFSGGSINSSSGTDLMSKAIIVPSFNTDLHHVNDGFIYLSNILIQFSATSVSTTDGYLLTKDKNYSVYYPINFNPLCVQVSPIFNGGGNSSNVCFQNLTTNDYFVIRITNNDGNLNWISISLAPTTPIYTSIRNINFSFLTGIAVAGKIQYLCDGTTQLVYKNTTYGYGNWNSISPTSSAWAYVTCSIDGKYVGVTSYDRVYVSSNYGLNWTPYYANNSPYKNITCSGNGYFYVNGGTTSNHFIRIINCNTTQIIDKVMPVNMTDITTNNNNTQVYVSGNDGIYKSNGQFSDFNKSDSTITSHITMNSTGQYIGAVDSQSIFISSDYGSTWRKINNVSGSWTSINSNSTGKLLCASTSLTIYYSNDYGETWNSNTNAPNNNYRRMSMNSEGNIATAITQTNVYVSFNASN